jgi:hypothetical protein
MRFPGMSLRRMKEDEPEEEDCAIEDERVLVFVFFASGEARRKEEPGRMEGRIA